MNLEEVIQRTKEAVDFLTLPDFVHGTRLAASLNGQKRASSFSPLCPGVLAFIYGDLIVLPILNIYRKYCGLKIAAFLFARMYVSMALFRTDQ